MQVDAEDVVALATLEIIQKQVQANGDVGKTYVEMQIELK
jgi:hypothetical protein